VRRLPFRHWKLVIGTWKELLTSSIANLRFLRSILGILKIFSTDIKVSVSIALTNLWDLNFLGVYLIHLDFHTLLCTMLYYKVHNTYIALLGKNVLLPFFIFELGLHCLFCFCWQNLMVIWSWWKEYLNFAMICR